MYFLNIFRLGVFVLVLSNVCQAQEKQKLTPHDYKLWHSLAVGAISDHGIWMSFSKQYKNGVDTLYLKNTEDGFQYTFPFGRGGKLALKGKLFAFLKRDTLCVLKTLTGRIDKYLGVKKFEFAKNGKYLFYLGDTISINTLYVKNIETGKVKRFKNLKEYSLDPTKTKIALVQEGTENSSVKIIDLATSKPPCILFESQKQDFQRLQWNESGESLAYYATDKITGLHTILFHENLKTHSLPIQLDPSELNHFPIDSDIVLTNLFISDNGKKVFFDVKTKVNMKNVSNVKVWHSSDKQLPPKEKSGLRWCVWFPDKNKFFQIETAFYENAVLTSDQKHILLLNNDPYLPIYEYEDIYSDVYIMDLHSGTRKKIIEKQLTAHKQIIVSSQTDQIAYLKNYEWWVYNLTKKTHTCVTKNLPISFKNIFNDYAVNHTSYGFGGWTSTGQLLVYDRFDIWLISPNGKNRRKITNGRTTGVQHRMYEVFGGANRESFFGFTAASYDPAEGLLVKTLNTKTLGEGFGIWTPEAGYQQIVQKDRKIFSIKKIKKNNSYQFIESSFDVSPRLMLIEEDGGQKQIAQANEQQKRFYWGKSELIHYVGPNDEKLKGALFYPANFQKGKSYPMIVNIYERMSWTLHDYFPPSLENFMGVNRTNFTSDGYFVLLPDITYTLNNPGNSALECVLAAVDETIKKVAIDEDNIGLTGHSFGGFETAYIVSQTDRFKTAMAGSGVMDLLSSYLQIDMSNRSNMERFGKGQLRNKIPFTKAGFVSESPIMNVETINTPLLLWTGGKDNNVDPWHTIKLYSALWRLQKKSTLLIYPDGIHVLVKPENKKDLTIKTLEWFNHYLKGAPQKDWMK